MRRKRKGDKPKDSIVNEKCCYVGRDSWIKHNIESNKK